METIEAQRYIATKVAERGYRAGYSGETYIGRQAIKLIEEAIERFECTDYQNCPPELEELKAVLIDAKSLAKQVFDDKDVWKTIVCETDIKSATKEDADVYVVISCDADGMESITGRDIQLAEIAVEKSRTDVARKVR